MTNTISLCSLKANGIELNQAIQLYLDAFPSCERRETDEWLACLDKKSQKPFTLYAINQNNNFAGFITCWELTDFVYVEHFAIKKDVRGNGIGAHAISGLKSHYGNLPIVLEVELPTEEISIRRIGFYERQGFFLNNSKYMQPPYHKEDDWLELKLMTTDPSFLEEHFERVRNDIYKTAYNINL